MTMFGLRLGAFPPCSSFPCVLNAGSPAAAAADDRRKSRRVTSAGGLLWPESLIVSPPFGIQSFLRTVRRTRDSALPFSEKRCRTSPRARASRSGEPTRATSNFSGSFASTWLSQQSRDQRHDHDSGTVGDESQTGAVVIIHHGEANPEQADSHGQTHHDEPKPHGSHHFSASAGDLLGRENQDPLF